MFKETKSLKQYHRQLLQWYHRSQRSLPWRKTADPYRIWVSEIMLQQTRVSTVIPYYKRFIARFPTPESLARAELEKVLKLWEGLGYYSRARNLHKAAKILVAEYRGELPKTIGELRKLPGIGPYVAAAIGSIAYDLPMAVVDGNVKRVLARIFEIESPVNNARYQKEYQQNAGEVLDRRNPGTYNQALMELGAMVCKPRNPLCSDCPLQDLCGAFQKDHTDRYPVRVARRKVPCYPVAIGIIRKDGRVLITRRKEEGLLGGLWEFPGGKIRNTESAEEACVREIREEVNLLVSVDKALAQVFHAYTHFQVDIEVFICRYVSGEISLNGPTDYRWILPEEIEKFPFPASNHKFIPVLKQHCQGEEAD